MVGPVSAREEDTARMTGARGDFASSLGKRVEALRVFLRGIEQNPRDSALRNGLLRRVHALGSGARVLGFLSVAEALTEVERRIRRAEFADVARSLDLLPSLVLGVPASLGLQTEPAADGETSKWPLSVLVFGGQALADAVQAIPSSHIECTRTEDLAEAGQQARLLGPDLAIIDADRPGARELVEALGKDLLVAPVPLVVIGDFASPEAASAFVALGAARVISKPVSLDALQRTVVELRVQATKPRAARDPLGDLSVEGLVERISAEVRRGLLDAVEPSARNTSVGFGDGADVMAAVWGAVARVRELVTLLSNGAVRFDSSGPEGAVPIAAWSNVERRAGQRGGAESRDSDDVTLDGRRIVVADDDPAVVWFMSGLLKALGVEVLEAHDGARALALTYESWPDLVVSDVLMPKLDGFSLCHEIKRDVAVRDVPVILLSWKEDLLQRVRELGGAADGYLRKEAAASTVAERMREVLRPRARVERRIAAGADVRGRLDGLTPRLILELASAGEGDVRLRIRDAVYLYEVQIRRGRLCLATRSTSDGSFERGELVLAALLGVSAGRFVIEPDGSPSPADFDGNPADMLAAPIARARAALGAISAEALVGVTRVTVATRAIERYLSCTPEPARGLLQKVMAGASPRELITTGSVAPHLLEAVLSDIARRGGITHVERQDGVAFADESALAARRVAAAPPSTKVVPASRVAPEEARPASSQDVSRFSIQIESAAPAQVAAMDDARSSEAAERAASEPLPFSAPSPPQSVPLPTRPAAASITRAEELDALASALTGDSPSPPIASPALVPQLTFEASLPLGSADPSAARSHQPASAPPTAAALATPAAATRAKASGAGAWLVRALLAFAVSYAVVRYYRVNVTHPSGDLLPGPVPTSSQ